MESQHQQDVARAADEVAQAAADNSQSEVAEAIVDAIVNEVSPGEVAAALDESEEQLEQDLGGVDGE